MTKDVLVIRVKEARGCVAEGDPCDDHNALATVADERDAALSRIADLERAAETSRAEHTAALGLATARIRELEGERDELLGLVKNDALWGSGCFAPFGGLVVDDATCTNDPPCWEHRRRAIVARIEKATKGTR